MPMEMSRFNECFELYTRCVFTFLKLLFDQADIEIPTATFTRIVSSPESSISSSPGFSDVKAIYLGEPQKKVLDLAADRSAYICQSQSLKCPPLGADTWSIHKYASLWVEE